MRKNLMMLAAAFGLAASQASAADLPRKAPAYVPPAPPPVTWTGCYIGANVGGIFTSGSVTFDGIEASRDNSGFAGGGQIGCDYQFSGGWVIGFRNMFDGTSVNRSRGFFDPAFGAPGTVNFNLNWFDTLTGRLGYAFMPGWLLYGQGGGAWVKTSTDVAIAGLTFGGSGNTRSGWTAGGGIEWMFAPHWSAFLEGNFMDFGSQNRVLFDTGVCAAGCAFNTSTTASNILVGVNYRFGGFGKAPY